FPMPSPFRGDPTRLIDWEATRDVLVAVARRIGAGADAEDVAHDALTNCFERFVTGCSPDKLCGPYLVAALKNVVRSLARDAARARRTPPQPLADSVLPSIASDLDRAQFAADVRAFGATRCVEDRQCLDEMLADTPAVEAAAALGWSYFRYASRRRRLLCLLEALFDDKYGKTNAGVAHYASRQRLAAFLVDAEGEQHSQAIHAMGELRITGDHTLAGTLRLRAPALGGVPTLGFLRLHEPTPLGFFEVPPADAEGRVEIAVRVPVPFLVPGDDLRGLEVLVFHPALIG
ncbi:MAG: hypothetical protein KDC87_16185, partial [Planctomycetes bacterium]|nr:hypothetical protein [Planctomycetota bacterium]